MKQIVALYARVSTSNQEEEATIESQIAAIEKYIQDKDVVDVTGCGDIVLAILAKYIDDIKYGCNIANLIAQKSVTYCEVLYIDNEFISSNILNL